MSLNIFWRLPANGDGRSHDRADWSRGDYQGVPVREHVFARSGGTDSRFTYFDYLAQIARAAELSGFDGVFIPQTDEGEEPIIVAGSLSREVRRITLVPQVPAHFLSAVYAAKIATSFQRLTAGRLFLNLAIGPPEEAPWHGQPLSEAEQVARADEFLTVFKGVWREKPYTFEGKYYEVVNGGFNTPLDGQVQPKILLGGSSDEALALSAKHADIHLLQPSDLETVARRIAALKAAAAADGRTIAFALEAEITARHDAAEAAAYSAGRWPNGAPDPGLTGTFAEVAERLTEYHAAGVETFILGAYPHLEETYHAAQNIIWRLPGRDPAQRKSA